MCDTKNKKASEKGNVLFLILIAVALFAALSYVVTQSTRSGGGSTEREKNILSSAQMTQYPTSLRTAIIRMILGGVAVENVKFDAPGSAGFTALSVSQLVFHPQGGGAGHQDAPADVSATGNANLTWFYNGNFYVPSVGIDTAGGNDIISFLPGVSAGVCRQVNEELGIDLTDCTLTNGVPTLAAATSPALINESQTELINLPGGPGTALQGEGVGCAAFTRQASGCFYHATVLGGTAPGQVFFSVLLER